MKKSISLIIIFYLSACNSNILNGSNEYYNGYQWAKDNTIDNFDDCQKQFVAGEAEDGCNKSLSVGVFTNIFAGE